MKNSHKQKITLWWKGMWGLPMRATYPLAEVEFDDEQLKIRIVGQEKYVFSKGEVKSIVVVTQLWTTRLRIVHSAAEPSGWIIIHPNRQEGLETLKKKLQEYGWPVT